MFRVFQRQFFLSMRIGPRTVIPGGGITMMKVGFISGITAYSCINGFNSAKIYNDNQMIDLSKHHLQVKEDAETFEMGLYEGSQDEELVEYNQDRNEKLNSKNGIKRLWYSLKFKINDYLLDPLITFSRFIELTLILLPVVVTLPVCLFGRRNQSGSKLWYKHLRWSAEIAGASFIKLGQWAATRTDLLPKEMCDEFNNLHANSKAHSLSQTKAIISKSFNDIEFDDIFEKFNETPMGVGAIAQVYLGKLDDKFINMVSKETNDQIEHLALSKGKKSPKNKSTYQSLIDKFFVTKDSLNSSQWVAIKVLHPNVERKINRDLKLMKFFANLINIIPTMEWLSLPEEVDQFSVLMRLQLDLRIEGLNLAKFRYNFKDQSDIHFPKPYLNYSTREVLVEEFIHAIPLEKILSIKENFGKNLSREISDKGLDSFLKMLILDNFIHADLHPGNMMVRFYKNELYKHEKEYKIVRSNNDSETNKITDELLSLPNDSAVWCDKLQQLYHDGYHAEICFLDVGIVTELNKVDRVNFIDLFRALSEFDGYRAGELMVERSRTPNTAVDKEIFALKVEKLVDRMKQRTFALGNLSIGDLLDQVLSMVRRHHVRMEGDFISVVVAILLLEGIGRQLDPNLDLVARFVYSFLFDYSAYQLT